MTEFYDSIERLIITKKMNCRRLNIFKIFRIQIILPLTGFVNSPPFWGLFKWDYSYLKGLTTGTKLCKLLDLGCNFLSVKIEAIYKILFFTNS